MAAGRAGLTQQPWRGLRTANSRWHILALQCQARTDSFSLSSNGEGNFRCNSSHKPPSKYLVLIKVSPTRCRSCLPRLSPRLRAVLSCQGGLTAEQLTARHLEVSRQTLLQRHKRLSVDLLAQSPGRTWSCWRAPMSQSPHLAPAASHSPFIGAPYGSVSISDERLPPTSHASASEV